MKHGMTWVSMLASVVLLIVLGGTCFAAGDVTILCNHVYGQTYIAHLDQSQVTVHGPYWEGSEMPASSVYQNETPHDSYVTVTKSWTSEDSWSIGCSSGLGLGEGGTQYHSQEFSCTIPPYKQAQLFARDYYFLYSYQAEDWAVRTCQFCGYTERLALQAYCNPQKRFDDTDYSWRISDIV